MTDAVPSNPTPAAAPASFDEAAGSEVAGALDRAAIERLWRENRRWIASVLIAHKPASADLEDLLQEVAMALVAKGHTIRDEAAARGWLRTVAINAARLAGRRRTRRGEGRIVPIDLAGPELADHDGAHDPASGAIERELHQRLAALPEAYREPLMLRAVRGLPASVIGEVLGLGEAAVNTRLARARRMLRGTLPARAVSGSAPGSASASAPAPGSASGSRRESTP
jgi:RNA polymerase sigma-70 factor (ECF subfamily)